MRANIHYSDLISRNWAFIPEDLQLRLRATTLGFAGCGLSSVIAVAAARMGCEHYLLADGDKVAASNLNRQAFDARSLGLNKAEATAALLRQINPSIQAEVQSRFLTDDDAEVFATKVDILVNTVDMGAVYFGLVKAAQTHKKLALCPVNVGFGCFLLAFNHESPSLEQVLGVDAVSVKSDAGFYGRLLQLEHVQSSLPPYLATKAHGLLSALEQGMPSPQITIGSHMVAAVCLTTVLKTCAGMPITMAPEFTHVDVFGE